MTTVVIHLDSTYLAAKVTYRDPAISFEIDYLDKVGQCWYNAAHRMETSYFWMLHFQKSLSMTPPEGPPSSHREQQSYLSLLDTSNKNLTSVFSPVTGLTCPCWTLVMRT